MNLSFVSFFSVKITQFGGKDSAVTGRARPRQYPAGH